VQAAAGEVIMRQEPGDRFYIVAAGEVEVGSTGQVQGRARRSLRRDRAVGDVPHRDVTARTNAELYALERRTSWPP
jgi:hypothetical protein